MGWIILAAVTAGFLLLFLFIKQQMKLEFLKLSQEALDKYSQGLNEKLKQERELAIADLDGKKEAVENTVRGLKEQLDKYEKLIREFEKDSSTKFGSIDGALKRTAESTNNLQSTTNRLTNILGNVKLRGQWGERMAEDIIRSCGLLEGINFRKQKKLDSGTTKPDYTFLLPDNHSINMDVKFPLDNYIQMTNTENEFEREQFKKEFLNNVKMRIRELQNRAYINPEEETLDFVLLFIPNEQVFGFIQENFPGLVDEALKQKVVLCSPFTLYAMLCVIRQAFENFRYEKATKEIVKMIELFAKTYGIFKTRFESLGEAIGKLDVQYNQIKTTSFKELDIKIRRIDDYKKGNVDSSLPSQKNQILEAPSEKIENQEVTLE